MSRAPTAPGLAQLLRARIDELEEVLNEIDYQGIRSADRFDELEQRASEAARGVRDAFRRGVWR